MSITVQVTGSRANDIDDQLERERWLRLNAGEAWVEWFLVIDRSQPQVIYTYHIEDPAAAMLFKLTWGGR